MTRYIGSKIGDMSKNKIDISPILDPIYCDISSIYHDISIYSIISCDILRDLFIYYISRYIGYIFGEINLSENIILK